MPSARSRFLPPDEGEEEDEEEMTDEAIIHIVRG